ncbi:MAG TPA: sigma 54-interacting transcriptional regulator, partial [Spirochaetota bacterium]|nr:sigma 54-interacting transcriptional regulator [Spirochaetota bacterium]
MSDFYIIVVDDEEELLLNMKDYFSDYNMEIFSDPEKAINHIKNNQCDIIISDYKMPKITGLDFLKEIKKSEGYSYAILYTAFAEKTMLEEMVNIGLINKVLEKPLMFRELKKVIDDAISFCEAKREKEQEIKILKNGYENHKNEFNQSVSNIIGINKGLKEVYEKVLSIAKHPINILLTGETGTGKELIAKAIHNLSPRKDFPFIKINTTAIPDTLFESELFGYKKGAFSNAVNDKAGKIELANKGTLFLDEIGDMNINLQSKLLRVLQEKEVERL